MKRRFAESALNATHPAVAALVAAIAGIMRSIGSTRSTASRRHSQDRIVLETSILPAYARDPAIVRVLFAGCAPYTRHYELIFEDREYWTIDPKPRRRRDGARKHVVDTLQRLDRHFARDYFDLILCNGVLGWGINTVEAAQAALLACHRTLRMGGHLMLGWNDVWPRNRVPPARISALTHFERATLGAHAGRLRTATPHRHVFDFYRKPLPDVGAEAREPLH